MSGEYCSRQATIQMQRIQLHTAKEINAFAVMNFSNMSDVVYNWRIKPFIESLKKYLWIEGDKILRPEEDERSKEVDIPIDKEIVETLKTILRRFRGVEALYRVKVESNKETNCDSRKTLCICPLEEYSASCLFLP